MTVLLVVAKSQLILPAQVTSDTRTACGCPSGYAVTVTSKLAAKVANDWLYRPC